MNTNSDETKTFVEGEKGDKTGAMLRLQPISGKITDHIRLFIFIRQRKWVVVPVNAKMIFLRDSWPHHVPHMPQSCRVRVRSRARLASRGLDSFVNLILVVHCCNSDCGGFTRPPNPAQEIWTVREFHKFSILWRDWCWHPTTEIQSSLLYWSVRRVVFLNTLHWLSMLNPHSLQPSFFSNLQATLRLNFPYSWGRLSF